MCIRINLHGTPAVTSFRHRLKNTVCNLPEGIADFINDFRKLPLL